MDLFGSSRKKESEEYEKEYLDRYNKQQKPKQKKWASKHKKKVNLYGFVWKLWKKEIRRL